MHAALSEEQPDSGLPTVKSALGCLFSSLSAAASPLSAGGPVITGLPPALQPHAAAIFALRTASAVVAAVTSSAVPLSSPRPSDSSTNGGEQVTAPTATMPQRISAAIDQSLGRHLNVMLRPQLAAQLRTTASSLSIAAEGAANGHSAQDFALPFLGESLLAALDQSGTSPPAGNPQPPAPLTTGPLRVRSAQLAGDGRQDLVPFTAFDDDMAGSGNALENGELAAVSDWQPRGGQLQEPWMASDGDREHSDHFHHQSELQPFTGVAVLDQICQGLGYSVRAYEKLHSLRNLSFLAADGVQVVPHVRIHVDSAIAVRRIRSEPRRCGDGIGGRLPG